MSISEPAIADGGVDAPEIRFPGGLPGFAGLERFALQQWGDESSPFSLLRSLEHDDLSFVVVPPSLFFPDYEPEIADEAAAAIGITSPDDAMLLVIVTVRQPVQDSTANLLGPLVINVHDLRGMQAVLEPDRWSTSASLVA
jgi:flagellar assembly factor FliW